MDRRKPRKYEDGLILDHHRIPHIQSGPNLVNKAVTADNVAYSPRRPALVVKDGVKKYGSNLILHNLNMFAKEGTIYCLVGASNTGKTTLIQCITGQRRLTKGELLVFGSPPGSVSSGIPGRRIGYMPQELGLHTDLSIKEVLQYHGRLNGMTLQQIGERTERLSELLDLQKLDDLLIKLSPGLRKRASLACALIHEPELIVLDEPTNGMDVLFQKGIWMHLQKLVSNGRTSVLLATQNLEEARQAHRIGVLRNGRLLMEDSPATLLQRHGTQLLAEAVAKLSIKDTIRLKKEGDTKKGKDDVVVCLDEWNSSFALSGIEESKNAGIISPVSYKDWVEQVNQCGDEDQIKLGLQRNKDKYTKQALKMTKDALTRLPPYPNPSRIGNRFRALFLKQFLIFKRNPFRSFLLSICIPLVVLLGFCHCIGRTGPLSNNVAIGIFNEDGDDKNFTWDSCNFVTGCTDKMLKCRFLDTIATKDGFRFLDFTSEEEALKEVKLGNIAALIKFETGFESEMHSQAVKDMDSGIDSFLAQNTQIKLQNLHFVLDEGNNIFLRQFLSEKLSQAVMNFMTELNSDCNPENDKNLDSSEEDNESATVFPIESQAQVSSNNNVTEGAKPFQAPGYLEFYTPSAMILLAFFTPLFISGSWFFFQEKKRGLLKRASVSGASTWESLFVHFFLQLPSILFGTTPVLILVPMFVFGVQIKMHLIWEVVLLLVLTGFLGMSLSFTLCIILDKYHVITLSGKCFLVVSLILSGLLWPVDSQHWIVNWVSHYLPLTLPTVALRSMIGKGWDLLDLQSGVWQGFAVIGAWTGFIWLVLILVLVWRYLRR